MNLSPASATSSFTINRPATTTMTTTTGTADHRSDTDRLAPTTHLSSPSSPTNRRPKTATSDHQSIGHQRLSPASPSKARSNPMKSFLASTLKGDEKRSEPQNTNGNNRGNCGSSGTKTTKKNHRHHRHTQHPSSEATEAPPVTPQPPSPSGMKASPLSPECWSPLQLVGSPLTPSASASSPSSGSTRRMTSMRTRARLSPTRNCRKGTTTVARISPPLTTSPTPSLSTSTENATAISPIRKRTPTLLEQITSSSTSSSNRQHLDRLGLTVSTSGSAVDNDCSNPICHNPNPNSNTITSSSNGMKNSTPQLYRYARKCQWKEFMEALIESTPDQISHVYKKDGTTALHLAIMSRTGYIHSFKGGSKTAAPKSGVTEAVPSQPAAPLSVIEALLTRQPQLAKIRCALNGYTPLIYACLACNEDYDTEDGAAMVRLFIRCCPESVGIFTSKSSRDGSGSLLSAVEIHIISYSHHHRMKEDDSSRGRTSTAVLRTLLAHRPDLANMRLVPAESNPNVTVVEGPAELLYRCNAAAFSKAVMDEVYNSDEEGTIRSDYTMPEKRRKVVDKIKTWWIWTWAVLILKYGSLANSKKKGARFAAVHTAALQVGVPTPLLSICLYAFPRQIKSPIEDKDDIGNMTLHAICSWPCHQDNNVRGGGIAYGDVTVSTRKSMAINRVLDAYPFAVKVKNAKGESALELALLSGTTWDGGVRRLVKTNAEALEIQSPTTRLYPFMSAAAAAAVPIVPSGSSSVVEPAHGGSPPSSPSKRKGTSSRRQDLKHIRTIYGLLRSNPEVLILSFQHERHDKK